MEEEEEVKVSIKHKQLKRWGHYGGRTSTLSCGITVTYNVDNNILTFCGIHSRGEGSAIGLRMDGSSIDNLIDELTKMRDDIVIANL